MNYFRNVRTAHAALGAVLLAITAACADVPSGLQRPVPGPLGDEHAVAAGADRALTEAATLSPRAGERRQRRTLRGADGQLLTVESILDATGRPIENVIYKDGAFVMRLSNTWAPGAPAQLAHQVALVRGADGRLRSLDSRDVPAADLAAAREKVRQDAMASAKAVPGRIRRLDGDSEMGVCDNEVKAADIATVQYVAAALSVILASSTGNPLAATAAYSLLLTTYANYTAKQVDLDKCVEKAGKKPVLDEF
jgi:hypothetical protein